MHPRIVKERQWDDLLSFVARDRREKLKNKGRFGQTLRTMREMFRLFYKELTGEDLEPDLGSLRERYSLNESVPHLCKSEEERLEQVKNDVQLLELVSNRYGLNPRPSLILYVEGVGEYMTIPQLAKSNFGADLATYGIELHNLHGLSNFTGPKRGTPYSTLERVIEENHRNQVVVFVILDDDNMPRARKQRKKLSEDPSIHTPTRTKTRREFIHIWEKCFELDNFTDAEIADVLTTISEDRYRFAPAEIQILRDNFVEQGDPISKLYKNKLDYDLDKVKFVQVLCQKIESGEDPPRAIITILDKILDIAALNHKPTWIDTSIINQESGYLGHPLPEGSPDPMAEKFEVLATLQEHLKEPQ